MRVPLMARGLLATWMAGMLAPGMALARDANTKENSTKAAAVGLTAASAVLLTKKNTRASGVAVGAGAAYAWKKHHDYVKQRHDDSKRKSPSRYTKSSGPRGRAVGYYTRSAHSGKKAVSPKYVKKPVKAVTKRFVKSAPRKR